MNFLKEKVENKISNLLIIKTITNKIDNIEYFNYAKSYLYKFKNFNYFLKAIEDGIVKISFNFSNFSNKNEILWKNHGVSFNIQEKDLDKIYDYICYF